MKKLLLGILLGLILGITFSIFAWVNPPGNPPTGGGVLQTTNTGLRINTSTYFISGNVGVGTTTPSAPLHIVSSGGPGIKVERTTDWSSLDLIDSGSTPVTWRLQTDSSNGFRISQVGVADMITITSNGNVGIGTTEPVEKLQVAGNVNIDNSLFVRSGSGWGGSPTISLAIGDNDTGFNWISDGNLAIYTNNSEKIRITSGGNVGIGTTGPSEKLHVVGNARIDGNLYVSGSMPPGIKRITIAMYRNLQHNMSSWSPFLPDTANFCFDASKYPSGYTAYILVSWCASNASGGNDWAGVRLLNVTTGGVVWQDTASVGGYAAQPYCGDFYRRVNTAISLTNGHCYRFEGTSEQGGQSVGIHIGDIYLDW